MARLARVVAAGDVGGPSTGRRELCQAAGGDVRPQAGWQTHRPAERGDGSGRLTTEISSLSPNFPKLVACPLISKKSNPVAYKTLIAESNAGLNPTQDLRKLVSLFSTDKAYLGVLDGVRQMLGRDIDFSKQGDREAIGNTLIQHIRKTGGCDVAGDKLQGCP
jgi:hypothetical protein